MFTQRFYEIMVLILLFCVFASTMFMLFDNRYMVEWFMDAAGIVVLIMLAYAVISVIASAIKNSKSHNT